MMHRAIRWLVPCALLGLVAQTSSAAVLDLAQVRTDAIAWLEGSQNADGSWGSVNGDRVDCYLLVMGIVNRVM